MNILAGRAMSYKVISESDVEKLNDVFIGYSPTLEEKKVGYLLRLGD